MEIRMTDIEIRVVPENGNIFLKGVLPVGKYSEILMDRQGKFFIETIRKGAFSRVLAQKQDKPKLLKNHNRKQEFDVKDFTYQEDTRGLSFLYTLKYSKEALKMLSDVHKLSFGFICRKDTKYHKDIAKDKCHYERIIDEFDDIIEISVLSKDKAPAYKDTKVFSGDSLEQVKKEESLSDYKEMKQEIAKLRYEQMKQELESLKKAIYIRGYDL